MTQHDDDQLDARLRAADPASSLPEADPAWVARLLEDTMSNDVLTESRENGTHNRSPLTWLVAAAAAVIIAGVGIFAVVNGTGGGRADPAARRRPTRPSPQLVGPGEAALSARCMVPNADLLADAARGLRRHRGVDLRRAGHPRGHPLVRRRPDRPGDRRGAERGDPASSWPPCSSRTAGATSSPPTTSGELLVCGFSAPYSQGLASLYDQAFPS